MTIWLLTIILFASLAGMGYRQGMIRVGFSFFGIVLGGLLAVPLSPLPRYLMTLVGVKQPLLLWWLPPFIVFVLVLIVFKMVGFAVHRKVEVHFKYQEIELRQGLWERVRRRVGLALGLVNALAYLVLISFVLYAGSYWTTQVADSSEDPFHIRLVNRLGHDMVDTRLSKVAGAVDRLPVSFYDAADAAGDLYRTPGLRTQLTLYPAFLALMERPELQDLFTDQSVINLWQDHAPLQTWMQNAKIQSLVHNYDLLREIWASAQPNLEDLRAYLKTGASPKFDKEKILGRWRFDLNGSLNLLRRSKPTISSKDMFQSRNAMALAFSSTSIVAMPDGRLLLKNAPRLGGAGAASMEPQTFAGEWKDAGNRYVLSITADGLVMSGTAEVKGTRLSLSLKGLESDLAFAREW